MAPPNDTLPERWTSQPKVKVTGSAASKADKKDDEGPPKQRIVEIKVRQKPKQIEDEQNPPEPQQPGVIKCSLPIKYRYGPAAYESIRRNLFDHDKEDCKKEEEKRTSR